MFHISCEGTSNVPQMFLAPYEGRGAAQQQRRHGQNAVGQAGGADVTVSNATPPTRVFFGVFFDKGALRAAKKKEGGKEKLTKYAF